MIQKVSQSFVILLPEVPTSATDSKLGTNRVNLEYISENALEESQDPFQEELFEEFSEKSLMLNY